MSKPANTRYALAHLGTQTENGTTLPETASITAVSGEIYAHTRDALYVWSVDSGKWLRCAE